MVFKICRNPVPLSKSSKLGNIRRSLRFFKMAAGLSRDTSRGVAFMQSRLRSTCADHEYR